MLAEKTTKNKNQNFLENRTKKVGNFILKN